MLRGCLIVNHFLTGVKYSEQTELYQKAAPSVGISLQVRTNVQRIPGDFDFALFLDKDVRLARLLEQDGMRVFNSAAAIALCDDKSLTYLHLRKKGIPLPKTLLVPLVFFQTDWSDCPFLSEAEEVLGYPMVAKANKGSFGQQVWLLRDRSELLACLNAHAREGMLLQEYIASSCGRDIRINVVGSRPVACMYRYSDTDFRANISAGGSMKPYEPDEKQVSLAVRACAELGLDFGGVDLLFGQNGEPILCEVNSNAHIRNIFNCTGVDVAHAILQHIRTCMEARA